MKPASFYNREKRSTSAHTKDNENAVSGKLKQKVVVKNVQASPKFMIGGKTVVMTERYTTQERVQILKPLIPPPVVKELCFGRGFVPNRNHRLNHLYTRPRHEALNSLLEDSLDRRETPVPKMQQDISKILCSNEITIKTGPEEIMSLDGSSLNEDQEKSGEAVTSFHHTSVCC